MKKTLIAMAALAVSGASFAQVTLTGTVSMGYTQTTGVGQTTALTNADVGAPSFLTIPGLPRAATGGSDASGLGIDTTELIFTAKEDLGSGQTIEAMMTIDTLNRGGVAGGDTKLKYTNQAFGRIELGTEKGAAVHSGIPSAGAPVINMDGKLFEIRTSSDYISYAVPIGPVALVIKHSEATSGLGLGLGMTGPAGAAGTGGTVGQRSTTLAALYTSGPLKLLAAYRGYDNQDSTTIASRLGLTKERVYALQAGYDLGVAQLGFGYNQTTASAGPKVADMLVGVNVPLGPITVGATWARASASGVADALARRVGGVVPAMAKADGDADGFSIGAQYDFSKRTNIALKHASWTRSGYEQFEAFGAQAPKVGATAALAEFGYTGKMTETTLLLTHSF